MSKRCSAKNRNGKRCGAWALARAKQCALHSDPGRAAELGSKHRGKPSAYTQAGALDLPHKALKSSRDVSELLEETINRVRQGSIDLRAANTIGFLAGIHMKAITEAQAEAQKNQAKEDRPLIYTALFARMRSQDGKEPHGQEEKVYDLYPQPQQETDGVVPELLPAPGEPIDDPQPTPESPEDPQYEIVIEVN